MILDGVAGRLYLVSAFFLFYFYCLLVLRACLVSHEPKGLPKTALEPAPAAP
jgi:hypothetical protein